MGLSKFLKIFALVLFVPAIVLIGLLPFVIESKPRVGVMPVATADDVAGTKNMVKRLRALTKLPGGPHQGSVTEPDLNSALALAAHAVPWFRGRASVKPESVGVTLSAKIPRIPVALWLNLEVAVRPARSGLEISLVQLGAIDVPPALVLPAAGFVMDVLLGGRAGQIATNSVDGVSIDGDTVSFGVNLTAGDRKMLAGHLKDRLRWFAGFSRPDQIKAYVVALDEAVHRRRLSDNGSLVPYLRFLMELVTNNATGGRALTETQTALFALAIYCGHAKFQILVGKLSPEGSTFRFNNCRDLTLAGRHDLRKHFVISAGLKAASDAGFAFAIGEFKELLDSWRGGSGFSFDDLAADRAGIRFASKLLTVNADKLKDLLARLTDETDIFPQISGLDVGLSREEFTNRYRNIESPAYKRAIAVIDRRLDGLDFYLLPANAGQGG
jgi:uncharacterized protein YfiM (DUF2279 family)